MTNDPQLPGKNILLDKWEDPFSELHVRETSPKRYVAGVRHSPALLLAEPVIAFLGAIFGGVSYRPGSVRRHELEHVRQNVWHHEKGIPLRVNSELAAFEEVVLMSPINQKNTFKRYRNEGKRISFVGLKRALHEHLGSGEFYSNFKYALAAEFPTDKAIQHAFIRMFRDPRQREILKWLGSHERNTQTMLPAQLEMAYSEMIDFLQKEAQRSKK